MGRNLDLAARRQAVLEASWRVIVRHGVGALTVRAVAAEAGLAPSSLRYTFRTQASVREHAVAGVGERLTARVAALPDTEGSAAWALAALLELLPLDAQRRLEMEVFLALGAAAMTDPDLQPLQAATDRVIRDVCARAVAAVHPGADATDVDLAHALVDGLALHLVQRPATADTAWAVGVVERHLATSQPRPAARRRR